MNGGRDFEPRAADVLRLAIAAGALAGIVEAAALLSLQRLQWLSWDMAMTTVSAEIVWIAPVFDMLLFGAAGGVLALAAMVAPRAAIDRLAIGMLAFLVVGDWSSVALTGRISHTSIVLLSAGLAMVCVRAGTRRFAAARAASRRVMWWAIAAVGILAAGVQGTIAWQERAALAAGPAPASPLPNVLVVVVDTLRADHLSGYGYRRTTSPNIDRIAREGVAFDNAFAASSWTLPSHASLLTGRYPHEHGAERDPLDSRLATLPEALQGLGYATAAFSANRIYFTRTQGFGRGFAHFSDYFDSLGDMAVRTLYGRKFDWFVLRRLLGREDYAARRCAADLTRDVERWSLDDHGRPAFVFVNYFDAHDPYLPPYPYRTQFSSLPNPGGIVNSFMFRLKPRMTAAQAQGEIDAYDGAIAYIDHAIGELMDRIRSSGRDWLVVVTSDHGEAFGEHGLYTHKNALYTELIRVPLIVWWPGHVPAGTRVDRPVSNASLAATLLEMIGAPSQATFSIPSLRPLWTTTSAAGEWPVPLAELAHMPYATLKGFDIPAYFGAMRSIVSGEDHYIVNEALGEELYRWRSDVREERNLAKGDQDDVALAGLRVRLGQLARTEW